MPAETTRRPDTEGAGVIWPAAAPGGRAAVFVMTTSWEKEGPRAVRPEPLPEDCLELVLNKETAGYAFLFAGVALHTDVNGERQVIRGRKPETNLAAS